MRALIVDDDPSLRMLLRRLFTRDFDVECLEAENGLAALDMLRQHPVDLVALDLRMPVMSGVDVLSAVRRSRELHELPVVVMSTMDDEDVIRRVVSLGVSDYLLKPFNSAVIAHRMRTLLGSGEIRRLRRPVKLTMASTVLVVDGDKACTSLLSSLLREFCQVDVTLDGVDALKRCFQQSYDAVLIGEQLGLLDRDVLLERLRAEHKTRFVPVVALGKSAGHHDDEDFDAVIPRSYVPEVVRSAVEALLGGHASTGALLNSGGTLEDEARRALAHTVGMLTQIDLTPGVTGSMGQVHRWAVGSMELVSANFSLDIQVMTPMLDARTLVAARDQVEPAAVGEAQALPLLEDLVRSVAGRVKAVLLARGRHTDAGDARVRGESTTGGWPGHPRATATIAALLHQESGLVVGLRLAWLNEPPHSALPANARLQ
jgi:CheY-like chemotaxis protein